MNKSEIIELIASELELLRQTVHQMDEQAFFNTPDGKWTTAQNIEHLRLSVKPLNQLFLLPFFAFRWMFGRPNRPSRTFDGLKEKYLKKLAEGGRATKAFIPNATGTKAEILQRYETAHQTFLFNIKAISESNMEKYLIPHPLLGKLTVLEMLYFTAIHVRHHHNMIIRIHQS